MRTADWTTVYPFPSSSLPSQPTPQRSRSRLPPGSKFFLLYSLYQDQRRDLGRSCTAGDGCLVGSTTVSPDRPHPLDTCWYAPSLLLPLQYRFFNLTISFRPAAVILCSTSYTKPCFPSSPCPKALDQPFLCPLLPPSPLHLPSTSDRLHKSPCLSLSTGTQSASPVGSASFILLLRLARAVRSLPHRSPLIRRTLSACFSVRSAFFFLVVHYENRPGSTFTSSLTSDGNLMASADCLLPHDASPACSCF